MIVSVAEAAEYWCPFASLYVFAAPARMVPGTAGGPANRYLDGATVETNPENCRCLGSQCMAWIWVSTNKNDPNRTGCCGLAHKRAGGDV